ncbi:MAG TPA: CBS domain-containing protein, partial [Nitrolancea sp.]|nr:CBS domain-containing protein [Nitrolancea sp.]
VQQLAALLVERNYRALPVVDPAGKLVGLVTNGDLIERGSLGLRAELLHLLDPQALGQLLAKLAESGRTAADVMTADVVTVTPGTSLADAAHLMALKRLKRLPVVDAEGRLMGIVARVDVLRAATAGAGAQPVDAETEVPAASPGATVAEVMTTQAPTVAANAGLPEVIEAVVSTRLNRAVVVDEERRPLGVVTDAELLGRLDPAALPGLARLLMGKLPFVRLSDAEREQLRFAQGTRAAELMLTPVLTVRGETPALEAASLMLQRRYKILPVVDAEGRLIGLLDRADLLRAVARR